MVNKEIENKEKLLKQISKELYRDEWFIDKAILSYKAQQEKTYTFFKDITEDELLYQYNWCQRPCDTNMSLCRFEKNATVCGWMSESLAERYGLKQITLDDFMHYFVKKIIEENLRLKDQLENHVRYIKCENCGIEIRVKGRQKYCDNCRILVKKEQERKWYEGLDESKKAIRNEKAKNKMKELRKNLSIDKLKN